MRARLKDLAVDFETSGQQAGGKWWWLSIMAGWPWHRVLTVVTGLPLALDDWVLRTGLLPSPGKGFLSLILHHSSNHDFPTVTLFYAILLFERTSLPPLPATASHSTLDLGHKIVIKRHIHYMTRPLEKSALHLSQMMARETLPRCLWYMTLTLRTQNFSFCTTISAFRICLDLMNAGSWWRRLGGLQPYKRHITAGSDVLSKRLDMGIALGKEQDNWRGSVIPCFMILASLQWMNSIQTLFKSFVGGPKPILEH
jgi:hypothetical protein